MDGYLLDTSTLITLLRPGHENQEPVLQRLRALPRAPLSVSVAAIAELEVGCHGGTADYEKARREITQLVADNGFKVRDITKHTVKVYGDLKWRLMVRFNRQGKAKRPETWPLPDTAGTLGIDEFDLLAAAHAMEFGLVLVTSDAMPRRIREVLDEMTPKLSIENWIKMPGQP